MDFPDFPDKKRPDWKEVALLITQIGSIYHSYTVYSIYIYIHIDVYIGSTESRTDLRNPKNLLRGSPKIDVSNTIHGPNSVDSVLSLVHFL